MPAQMKAGVTAFEPRIPTQCTHKHAGRHDLRLFRSRACTKQSLCCRAQANKVAEPLRAPGSESNFTDLPKNREDITLTSDVSDREMQEHIDLARSDFPLVFKDILDVDHFERNMFFSDPISRYTFFRGYQFNVTFLRKFLAPIFEVHEIRQAGPHEILMKWSWTMNFWWLRFTPFKLFWDPRLAFTGITILGYNAETGKWNKHVDGWDCLQDQEFLSLEGALFVARQMFQVSKPDNLPTPEFGIMKKYKDWEIRRYKPFVAARVTGRAPDEAEDMLRRYLDGANRQGRRFEFTTPLLRDSDGAVSLMLPGVQDAGAAPEPQDAAVSIEQQPERWYAAGLFGGSPSQQEIDAQVAFVRGRAQEEGTQPLDSSSWVFARYNHRSWPLGPFRRNEVLVPVDAATFDLWRGVDFAFVKRIVERPV